MTEQQEYRVLDVVDGVELREYAPCVVADIVVEGSMEQAGTVAFGPLVSYISREQIAMTAPVLQQATGERWTVSFVLPAGRTLEEYPVPGDARVTLRALPSETAAAIRWSGRWTERNVAQHTERLVRTAAAQGWQPDGDPRWARFDPPWKPPFARRNEVVLPVRVG